MRLGLCWIKSHHWTIVHYFHFCRKLSFEKIRTFVYLCFHRVFWSFCLKILFLSKMLKKATKIDWLFLLQLLILKFFIFNFTESPLEFPKLSFFSSTAKFMFFIKSILRFSHFHLQKNIDKTFLFSEAVIFT